MATTATPEAVPAVRQLTYLQAVQEAQAEEMRRDPSVVIWGQGVPSGYYGMTVGFLDEFGPQRVRDTPMSEAAEVGAGVGAAMTGLRPIVDLTQAAFAYIAFDQIVHQAATARFMSGGQTRVPLVIRLTMGYAPSRSAHHADRPYPIFLHFPGLKIVTPSTPYDAKGLLKTAIRDDSVVMFFRDGTLAAKGPVPAEEYLIPFGVADVKRKGSDATIVAIAGEVIRSLKAAEALEKEGIDVEVVDPRTLRPLDTDAILASVRKTGRLVVTEPANRACGAAAEISAIVAEQAFDALKAPIVRVTCADTHPAFSPPLVSQIWPTPEKIADAVRRVVGKS